MSYRMDVVDADGHPVPGALSWECAMAGGKRLALLLIKRGMAYWPAGVWGSLPFTEGEQFTYDEFGDPAEPFRSGHMAALRATGDER